jgi:hypothetical protein
MLVAMSHAPNPYAAPKHDDTAPVVSGEVAAHEATRREHINAETNVKTIGFLLYLGAFSCLVNGLPRLTSDLVGGMVLVVVGAAMGWGGYWLRRLDPRGRTIYTVLAAILVVGTLARNTDNLAYQLGRMFWPLLLIALLWGRKAGVVLTPHYREVVVPATPHVKYKTSPWVIALGLVLIGVLILFIVLSL